VVGDRFFTTYLKDAKSEVRMFDLSGKRLGDVKLPGIGSASGFTGRRADRETFYSFTTFVSPPAIYRYDIDAGKSTLFREPSVPFKSSDYETKQVFYKSK